MKILFATFVAICAFALNCSAQWSHAGTNVFLSTITDYVGIGTGTPPTKLTVLDSVNALQLRLGGVVPSLNPAMRWTGRNAANTTNRSADIQLDADAGIFNFFAPSPSTPVVKAMSILTGGNVGIGTTAPSNLLEVSGANTTPLTLTRTTAASNVSVEFKNGTASWFAGQGSNGNFGIATSNDVGASTAFNVTPAGNVGIGITAPADKLEVSGNILLSQGADRTFGIPDPTTSTIGNNLTIRASSGGTGGAARVGGNLNLTAGAPYSGSALNGASGNVVITAGGNTGAGSGGGAIMFQTGKTAAETMRVDALGNVGIGTTAPGTKLEIQSSTATAGDAALRLSTAPGNIVTGNVIGDIQFYGNDASTGGTGTVGNIQSIADADWTGNSRSAGLAFLTTTGVTTAEKLRILGNGNVGVGTAVPARKFTVNGAANPTIGISVNDAEKFIAGTATAAGSGLSGLNVDDTYLRGTGSVAFGAGYSGSSLAPQLFLSTAGRTGMGTLNPTTRLAVSSGATAPTTPDLNNSITIGANAANSTSKYLGQLGFVSGDSDFSTPKMVAYISAEATETYSSDAATGSLLRFYTGSNAGTNPTERMVINNLGRVGIGTPHPDQALTVNGQVHSTSVVVTSTVPADYVFNSDYHLRPLADVKAFVDKNHHLPEVPSAAEFKKAGQNLGEMNMTLLKKVEELTLYMIELNKTVKTQQGEIERLKKGRR